MTDHTARICLDADGRGTVQVDGHDLSHATRGLSLHATVDARPQLLLDLRVDASEINAEDIDIRVPAETAAALVTLGWTPPDDGQPVDLTDPKRHDQIIKIIKAEARRDPDWFRTLLRREDRIQGGRPDWRQR
jgi:hypothetical protein